MTAKALVLELIQKLPDDAGYEQIARAVALVAGICEAQVQIACGECFSAEEILKEMLSWVLKSCSLPTSRAIVGIS